MAHQLVMKSGPIPGKIYPVEKSEIYLGREAGNDIFINEPEVSRRHARLSFQSGNYVLEDLGSTNGTFVNGQRVSGLRILHAGDTITLGENVSLTFELASFDPNATVASTPGAAFPSQPPLSSVPPSQEAQPAKPQPEAYPSPSHRPQPRRSEAQASPQRPAYTSQVPPTPAATFTPEDEEAEERPSRTWLWAGCGCLVVLLCVLVAGAWVFDSLNLYCTPPFRDAMVLIGAACP